MARSATFALRGKLTHEELRASPELNLETHLHFDAQRWGLTADELFAAVDGMGSANAEVRGKALFFRRDGTDFVCKHYRRGGWIRRLVRDRYVFTGVKRARMWREYDLLNELRALGLPVPEPVAARCICHKFFLYSGDLITVRLAGAETLGQILRREPLPEEMWSKLGVVLAEFHRRDVYHADLNIENIMLGPDSGVALIDFDKGAIRASGKQIWIRENMQRLLRSLRKESARSERFHFAIKDWEILSARHEESLRGSGACRSSRSPLPGDA